MKNTFQALFLDRGIAQSYQDGKEYLSDLGKLVDIRLVYYFRYINRLDVTGDDVLKKYKGTILSRREIDAMISDTALADEGKKEETIGFLRSAQMIVNTRKQATSRKKNAFVFDYVADTYQFDEFERFCLLVSLLPYMDEKYKVLFSFAMNHVSHCYLDLSFAHQLYTLEFEKAADAVYLAAVAQRLQKYVLQLTEQLDYSALCAEKWLAYFIFSQGVTTSEDYAWMTLEEGNADYLPTDRTLQQLDQYMAGESGAETAYFYLYGQSGLGKKTAVKEFCSVHGASCLLIDCKKLKFDRISFDACIYEACRQTMLLGAIPCFVHTDLFLEESVDALERHNLLEHLLRITAEFCTVVFLLSAYRCEDMELVNQYGWISLPLQLPKYEQRLSLWEYYLHTKSSVTVEDGVLEDIAGKFCFSAGQIAGAVRQAKNAARLDSGSDARIQRDQLYRSCYNQAVNRLDHKATLLYPKNTWADLILAEEQKRMLKNACNQITYKHQVFDVWGFSQKIFYGTGISMLFAGLPGTGKTMAAQVIAKELNIEIYKADLSKIVSKYIGETEKNLDELFTEAQKTSVILFFDEMDALFGKRTEVKDSHDKNANLETAYLLQKMEEYDGITIMSTNYLENIDTAFFRRINYIVHFPFPDKAAREQIWRTIFPPQLPKEEDLDFAYLAEQFELAGGNIKNIALTASFMAAGEHCELQMRHILKAVKYELQKQGKILIRSDFGIYSYLIDGSSE